MHFFRFLKFDIVNAFFSKYFVIFAIFCVEIVFERSLKAACIYLDYIALITHLYRTYNALITH